MTSAGYIHDQRCPVNPEHGNANALDAGMYCPHAGHTPVDPEKHTQAFWTWSEWEATKTGEPKSPPIPTGRKPRAIALRPRSEKTSRRRTR